MSTAMAAVIRMSSVFQKAPLRFVKYGCNFLSNEQKFSITKVDVPSPPKRPLTAYMIFCKENRKNLVQNNPSLNIAEQIKVLAEKWTNLDPNSKKVYEDTAREGVILYGQAHKEFYESLTDTQRVLLSKMKEDKKESRRIFRLKKALKESGVPKRPSSAYAIFVKTKAKEKTNLLSLVEFTKDVASTWRNFSDEQKQPYIENSRIEKEEYELQIKKWRAAMISSGHNDLIKAYDDNKIKGKKISSKDTEVKAVNKEVE